MSRNKQFSLGLSDSLKDRMQVLADRRQMQLSTFIRWVLVDYLIEEEHKLGITRNPITETETET